MYGTFSLEIEGYRKFKVESFILLTSSWGITQGCVRDALCSSGSKSGSAGLGGRL